MVLCSRCGTAAQPDDVTCRTCGAPLPRAVAPAAADPWPAAAPASPPSAWPLPAPATPPMLNRDAARAAPLAAPVPAAPSPAGPRSPQGAPTYPYTSPYGYPTAGAPYGYQPYAPYQYAYPYYGYPYPYPLKPQPAKGEGYRLALAWITTIASGLMLLAALGLSGLFLLASLGGGRFSLATLGDVAGLCIGAVVGGVAGLYFGIRALVKQPSARFGLPPAWVWLVATLVVFGGEVVLWNVQTTPTPELAVLPLFMLAGALPAATILAFAAQRLGYPSTWRHVVISLVYGAVVATLVASFVESALFLALVVLLARFGIHINFGENFLQTFDPSNPLQVLMFILVASVVAPLVEEGFKPIGAVFLLPRVRGPAEAFLLGLVAGEGFAVIETLSYFGLGQADWISVAIDRVGAGLLHGVGAGMGAVGWYYLIRGKGVPQRWLWGFGALGYAVIQHGIFNAASLMGNAPLIGRWLSSAEPLATLGALPIERSILVEGVLYALVLSVLIYMTGLLRRAPQSPATGVAPTSAGAREPQPMPAMAAGGAR
jgi:RsiW-degrading membrane proteinase PrsW (M82 family)